MKTSPNKFIAHLSDDILNQNHHLKTEIIKIRKELKNYEDSMVKQFIKIADQLALDKPGFIFEAPEECLRYFISVIDQHVTKNRFLKQEVQAVSSEIKKVKAQNEVYLKRYQQIRSKQKQKDDKICNLEELSKKLTINLEQQAKITKQMQENCKAQLKNMEEENSRKEKEFNIKYLEEKKALMEKTNKQIAQYRLQMDEEMNKKEKEMKIQMDKKDREAKSLLQTINTLVQRHQKQQARVKYKYHERTKSQIGIVQIPKNQSNQSSPVKPTDNLMSPKASEQFSLENPIQVLKQYIKPFTEHTNLLEKVSELRKQNMQLKSDLRKSNTLIVGLQSSLMQKNNDLSLQTSRLQSLKVQHQKIRDELAITADLLQKSNNQKDEMQRYYNERWNSQFNKVKYNLQKKFEDKTAELDQEYAKRKQDLLIQTQKIFEEIKNVKKQNEKLRKRNEVLAKQKLDIEKQVQNLKLHIVQLQKRLWQNAYMHKQEILSIHCKYEEKYASTLAKLKNNKSQILRLQSEIDESSLAQTKIICQLKAEFDERMKQKIEELKQYYEQRIEDNNKYITKLSIEIQSHKAAIEDMQRQRAQKIEQIQQKLQRERQKQVRELKMKSYQEVAILKQKLSHSQNSFKDFKQHVTQKQDVFQKQKQQKLNTINKKQQTIKQLQNKIKECQGQYKKLEKICTDLRENITNYELKIESKNVENNSLNCIIQNKEEQIRELYKEKKHWMDDIEDCKKQFYKGFGEIKEVYDKKISFYKSRIWELEQINQNRGISQKDLEKIRSLTEEKKKLQTEVAMKQAQNLILTQVKEYYETKSKDLNSKMMTDFELKQQRQAVLIRKPKRTVTDMSKLKTVVQQDLMGFSGRESYEIKQLRRTYRVNNKSSPQISKMQADQRKQYRKLQNRIKVRVNSSVM